MKERDRRRTGPATLHEKLRVPVRPDSKKRSGPGQNPAFGLQRTVGNQAVASLFESGAVQAKLRVSQPQDADEIEADRVAEQVVGDASASVAPSTAAGTIHRKCSCPGGVASCPACEEEEVEQTKGIHRKSSQPSQQEQSVRDDFLQSLGPGQPLDPGVQKSMESRFGRNFECVRVHTDAKADESARSINARAFTAGRDVVFGGGEYAPQSSAGRKLLAHELAHVVQQGKFNPTTTGRIQRRVNPEDVSSEMGGQQLSVTTAFTSGVIQLSPGDSVVVVAWSNSSPIATVQLPYPRINAHVPFDIPKRLLRKDPLQVPGIAHYRAGVTRQALAVERGEQAIAQEQTRKGGPRPGEISRLQGLQQRREQVLNRKLIQETMLNRFDSKIRRWVDFYNQQFGFTGSNASAGLDPNLVKSLFFQESQMGTSGEHLEIPPSHPVKSRFNIGQMIDSSASALLLMIRELQPALIAKHHLVTISLDLAAAQSELSHLRSLHNLTTAQQGRLALLEPLSHQNWEVFLWSYKAPGQATGFNDAVKDLFASAAPGQPALNLDYDFWIQTAVRWIFEKRRGVSSWDEAIRAYNGSGARAQHYRDAVQQRTQAATTAQASSSEFIPSGI